MMSAPEQPMLCAPIVSQTCAATMQSGRQHIQLFGDHVVHLPRRFESAHAIDAERLFEPSVDAGVLQRAGLWVGAEFVSVTRRNPASFSCFSPPGTSGCAGIVSIRILSSSMSACSIDTCGLSPASSARPVPT